MKNIQLKLSQWTRVVLAVIILYVIDNPALTTGLANGRYSKLLESSPHLREQLETARQDSLSLAEEIALARTLLGEVVRAMARAHGATGVLQGDALHLVMSQLRQIESLIATEAAAKAKSVDQTIDLARLAVLLAALRDDMRRSVSAVGMVAAVPFIDAAFNRAKWTGGLNDQAVREALEAPAAYDVEFRPLDRVDGKVVAIGTTSPDAKALVGPDDPRMEEARRLQHEIEQAQAELPVAPRSRRNDGDDQRLGIPCDLKRGASQDVSPNPQDQEVTPVGHVPKSPPPASKPESNPDTENDPTPEQSK